MPFSFPPCVPHFPIILSSFSLVSEYYLAMSTLHEGIRDGVVVTGRRYLKSNSAVVRSPLPVKTGPGDNPASFTMATRSFLGVKRPERGADHPNPSSAG
jgi:hypothetical protein